MYKNIYQIWHEGFEKTTKSVNFALANYQLPPNPPGLDRSKGRQVVAVNLPFFVLLHFVFSSFTTVLYCYRTFSEILLIISNRFSIFVPTEGNTLLFNT